MIYRSDDIPEGYNKIAEISDNYLVWVRESLLSSGTKYSAYIQFMKPSISVLFTNDYMISSGTDYEVIPHYTSGGMYTYVDSYDVDFTRTTISVPTSEISNSNYDRSDMPQIFVCQFICVLIVVWILNQLSKLVHKGGAFGG